MGYASLAMVESNNNEEVIKALGEDVAEALAVRWAMQWAVTEESGLCFQRGTHKESRKVVTILGSM